MDSLIISTGEILDLSEGIPIPLNLSVADFREPDKRQRNFSKEIDLPGTSNNRKYLFSSFSVSNVGGDYDFNPSARVNCTYYKRGIPVMPNAILKLNRVVVKDGEVIFKVGIFAEFVDVFLLLANVDIRDLDWSDYSHTLNNSNIINSWSTPLGQGYYYPLIERNQRTNILQWKNTDLIPYVHMVDVFKRCMDFAGQKYVSEHLESGEVKSILYGYGGGNYVDTSISPSEQNNRKVLLSEGQLNITQSKSIGTSGNVSFFQVFLEDEDPETNSLPLTFTEDQDIYQQYLGNVFTAQRAGTYKFTLTGEIRIQFQGTFQIENFNVQNIYYRKNGASLYPIVVLEQSSDDQTFNLNLEFNVSLNSGDTISLVMGGSLINYDQGAPGTLATRTISTISDLAFSIECTDTNLTEGSLVEVHRFIPSMKCSDFILGIIRLYNLMISDPDIYGVVTIEPAVGFYKPTNENEDITEEVDVSKEIDIRPTANEFAKTLSYLWKVGTEFEAKEFQNKWNHGYGNLSFDQPSFFAKGEQKIELPFAPIIPYEVSPGILVPRFVDIDNSGIKKTTAGIPRLMYRNGMKSGEWQLVGSTTNNLTEYPSVHHFDDWEDPSYDLNFQLVEEVYYNATVVTTVNTYSRFYSPIVNEIISRDGKYVTLYRRMNNSKVKNIDWAKLLKWNGSLFKLNKIIDYDSEITEITKIELLKVIEARSPNRKTFLPFPVVPAYYLKVIESPRNNVGTSAKVISGGSGNQILELNKVIRG